MRPLAFTLHSFVNNSNHSAFIGDEMVIADLPCELILLSDRASQQIVERDPKATPAKRRHVCDSVRPNK